MPKNCPFLLLLLFRAQGDDLLKLFSEQKIKNSYVFNLIDNSAAPRDRVSLPVKLS